MVIQALFWTLAKFLHFGCISESCSGICDKRQVFLIVLHRSRETSCCALPQCRGRACGWCLWRFIGLPQVLIASSQWVVLLVPMLSSPRCYPDNGRSRWTDVLFTSVGYGDKWCLSTPFGLEDSHTRIREKLLLLSHKMSCCTSTWPSLSLLRGWSDTMAPRGTRLRIMFWGKVKCCIMRVIVNKIFFLCWWHTTAFNQISELVKAGLTLNRCEIPWNPIKLASWLLVRLMCCTFCNSVQSFSFWVIHLIAHSVTDMKRHKKSCSLP